MWLDRQAWLFSIKTFIASITALYVALAGNLSRPYWAMATVYIVAQPMLGPTRAKGAYRIIGTLIAGVAILAMLPNLVETPLLLSAAISLWLSLCLFLALLDRGPRGYAFMLAGYTCALIGFPAVSAPETIFDNVISRSEEIVLGAVVTMLFSSLVFPASVQPMLASRIGSWMRDAAQWCREILAQGHAHRPRNQLAADLVQFDSLIEFVRHDDLRHANAVDVIRHLRERMLLLLPVLSSISDRLRTLHARGYTLPTDLEPLLADIGDWLETPIEASSDHYAALRRRVAALKPDISPDLDRLLLATLLLRLEEVLDLWQDCRTLADAIQHGSVPNQRNLYYIAGKRGVRERHVDYGMMIFSALSAGIALMAYCVLWIGLGWQAGASGAMMAAVASAFFAAQDDPAPSMTGFLAWSAVGSLGAGLYQFGIFPAIHDFGMLVLVLVPAFLPLGLLIHNPKTALFALPLTVNLMTLINVQSSYSADIQSFINSAVAMILGIAFSILMTRLFRSVGAEWTARRLVRQGWATLAEAAEGHGRQDRHRFIAHMLDLLGLLAPRLAATPEGSELVSIDMLGEVRAGLNILKLRRARLKLPERSAQAVNAILDEIAAHYRRQAAARRQLPGPASLQQLIDASLARVGQVAPGKARDEALMGLIGLRYSLFPEGRGLDNAAT